MPFASVMPLTASVPSPAWMMTLSRPAASIVSASAPGPMSVMSSFAVTSAPDRSVIVLQVSAERSIVSPLIDAASAPRNVSGPPSSPQFATDRIAGRRCGVSARVARSARPPCARKARSDANAGAFDFAASVAEATLDAANVRDDAGSQKLEANAGVAASGNGRASWRRVLDAPHGYSKRPWNRPSRASVP